MLSHARLLREDGHSIQVLGATPEDRSELGIEFVGSRCRTDQERLLHSEKIDRPDLILLEGAHSGAPLFRELFPRSCIVHVGQNIDHYGTKAALRQSESIDYYAAVGVGQHALLATRFPAIRQKLVMLRNCVPQTAFAQQAVSPVEPGLVLWVGNWNKAGLRKWTEVMARVLSRMPRVRWILAGPSYGLENNLPDHLGAGLSIPKDRVEYVSVPPSRMPELISRAQVVLTSLGNECGPISILDAHAAGRPTISGTDLVYFYANPPGIGLRVRQLAGMERALTCLLESPSLCDRLGRAGRKFVIDNYTEHQQRTDLNAIMELASLRLDGFDVRGEKACDYWGDRIDLIEEKVRRRARRWFRRV